MMYDRHKFKKSFKRKKFNYRYLEDSGSLYCRYSDLLNLTLKLTYKGCITPYLPSFSYFDTILHNIIAYNRCFFSLAKAGEIVAAYPLIRLVADNLKILVAEYLYPEKVLPPIFEKGKELTDIRIKGEKIKSSDINREVATLFPEYPELYQSYSFYIHPSKEGDILGKIYGEDKEVAKEVKHSLRTIKRTKAEWDLVKLNQYVVDLLVMLIERNIALIKESPELTAVFNTKVKELLDSYPD